MKNKFLGKVASVKEGSDGYIISFDILGLDEFLIKPTAIPIGHMTQEIKVGDLVLIENLSNPNEMHYFTYQPVIEGAFIGVKNGPNSINLTDKAEVTVNLPGISVSYKDSKISINISSSVVDLNLVTCKLNGDFLGSVTPSGQGPFCALPNCLFTGAPHTGTKVSS